MLKTIDSILFSIWKVIDACVVLVFHMIQFLLPVLRIFPGCIFKLPFLRVIARIAFKISHSRRTVSFCEGTQHCSKKFSKKMFDSALFRRVAFLIFGILLFLYVYPPSHWGPWYKYQEGVASNYSTGFWFNRTANGEIFIPWLYTAASKDPRLMNTTVKVVNPANGKTVYVWINDKGPFVKGRIIDLSSSAAKKIGLYEPGTGKVIIYTHRKY